MQNQIFLLLIEMRWNKKSGIYDQTHFSSIQIKSIFLIINNTIMMKII